MFLFIYPCDHLGKSVQEMYLGMKLLCHKVWATRTSLDIATLPSE